MANITTVQARDKLKPRNAPHWVKVSSGCYVGFRRLTSSSVGTWLARYRDTDTGKVVKKSLGDFEDLLPSERFDAAKKAAEEWFAHLGKGGSTEEQTVKEACEAYVQHLRDGSKAKTADDADGRYRRLVYSDRALSKTKLAKLTKVKVKAWVDTLKKTPAKINRDDRETPLTRPRSPSSVNRDMTALRAALNFALDQDLVTTDAAWRVALRPIKNADGRRETYLDRAQRQALIGKAQADVAILLRGLSLLPLRPGALAALTVGDFDKRQKTLRIGKDKTGKDRRILLPESTAAFIETQIKDKLPAASIFNRADGKPWDKDSWKSPIKDAVKAAELDPKATAYTLRHSTITDLVVGGLDLLTVAQLSGTSVAMIEKHYGHLNRQRAADALAGLAL